MMNVIALGLITTSILVTGLFSPSPVSNNKGEQVIVKDGHRAVVVEYADVSGDGNTKVSISPPHHQGLGLDEQKAKLAGSVEEQLSRATASVAGVAQDVEGKAKEVLHGGPKELICDAYGKCKEKVSGVLNLAKGKAVEAEETVEDTVDTVKGFASRATGKVGDKVEEVKDRVKETGEKMKGKTVEMAKEAGEKTADKVRKAGEMAKETGEGIKGKTEDLVGEAKDKVMEKGRKGKKELSDIVRRGKEVVMDVIGYVFGAESIGSLMNLMGFAMAYGTGIWVTFVMSYVLAGVLPRQQFGMVQSRVYPVYFKVMASSIGLALLGHLLGHGGHMLKSVPTALQTYNLTSSLLMVLANLLFLEPRATKVMFQRMKLEKEEGRGIDGRNSPAKVIDTVVTDTATPTTTTTPSTTTSATTYATVVANPTPTATPTSTRTDHDAVKSKLIKLDNRLKKFNSYSSLLNVTTLMGLTWHLLYLSQRLGVTT